jgi:hypothetical protein
MVDYPSDNNITNSRRYIINSYENLLIYYRNKGLGNKSEIAGVIITEDLINTIERRYKQLGGNPVMLYLRASKPSLNGQLKEKEPKR